MWKANVGTESITRLAEAQGVGRQINLSRSAQGFSHIELLVIWALKQPHVYADGSGIRPSWQNVRFSGVPQPLSIAKEFN